MTPEEKKLLYPGREPLYKSEFCEKIKEWMAAGLLQYELAAKLKISTKTIQRWRESYPEFGEAYDEGHALCFSWWMGAGRERFMADSSGGGFKYWVAVMNNVFKWNQEEKASTTINIGSMNVLQQKSTAELQNYINNQLFDLDIIDVKPLELTDDSKQE